MEKELTFEEIMKSLEDIVKELEDGNLYLNQETNLNMK